MLPASAEPVKHLNALLSEKDISDVVVCLDEADAVWTTDVALAHHKDWASIQRERLRYSFFKSRNQGKRYEGNVAGRLSKREVQMLRLLGWPAMNRDSTKGPISRVRSLAQISATHLATIQWHMNCILPFLPLICSVEDLSRKRYTGAVEAWSLPYHITIQSFIFLQGTGCWTSPFD